MAELTKEQQLQYNLTILKRRDAAISGVVDMAGHVVIYKFSEETQAWDRRNVEGSLFVVSRCADDTWPRCGPAGLARLLPPLTSPPTPAAAPQHGRSQVHVCRAQPHLE